mmetsp:Transcript_20668/g.57632  ORF Transcript_20668/g.57632 Transcript_20668/m.57632 type:complete len:259 (-) Transcript_20668:1432-2208(-)
MRAQRQLRHVQSASMLAERPAPLLRCRPNGPNQLAEGACQPVSGFLVRLLVVDDGEGAGTRPHHAGRFQRAPGPGATADREPRVHAHRLYQRRIRVPDLRDREGQVRQRLRLYAKAVSLLRLARMCARQQTAPTGPDLPKQCGVENRKPRQTVNQRDHLDRAPTGQAAHRLRDRHPNKSLALRIDVLGEDFRTVRRLLRGVDSDAGSDDSQYPDQIRHIDGVEALQLRAHSVPQHFHQLGTELRAGQIGARRRHQHEA